MATVHLQVDSSQFPNAQDLIYRLVYRHRSTSILLCAHSAAAVYAAAFYWHRFTQVSHPPGEPNWMHLHFAQELLEICKVILVGLVVGAFIHIIIQRFRVVFLGGVLFSAALPRRAVAHRPEDVITNVVRQGPGSNHFSGNRHLGRVRLENRCGSLEIGAIDVSRILCEEVRMGRSLLLLVLPARFLGHNSHHAIVH